MSINYYDNSQITTNIQLKSIECRLQQYACVHVTTNILQLPFEKCVHVTVHYFQCLTYSLSLAGGLLVQPCLDIELLAGFTCSGSFDSTSS